MRNVNDNLQRSGRTQRGFSLLEMLITIMIIAFGANFAVMAFGGARQGADDQKDKRNAQEIASVAATASAAGADFIVPGDEAATIANLSAGCSPASGMFRGRIFKIPDMHEAQIKGAMRFLSLNDTDLQYRQDGSGSP